KHTPRFGQKSFTRNLEQSVTRQGFAEKQQFIIRPKRNFVAHSPHLPLEPDPVFHFALTLHLDRFLLAFCTASGAGAFWGGWRGNPELALVLRRGKSDEKSSIRNLTSAVPCGSQPYPTELFRPQRWECNQLRAGTGSARLKCLQPI